MARTTRRPIGATNGSNAYDLNYIGEVVAASMPGTVPTARPADRPQTRKRTVARVRERTRVKVQVREQQAVAPFAICGFLAVVAIAVVMLLGYVQLNSVYAETVQLQSQLTELRSEGANLEARYEETFDRESLQRAAAADGTLQAPTAEQSVYLDLSQPDNAVLYNGGGNGAVQIVLHYLGLAVEFFR